MHGQTLLYLILTTSLLGCQSTGGAIYSLDGIESFGSWVVSPEFVTEPKVENNYQGLLTEVSKAFPGRLEIRAREICSTRGGIKLNPTFIGNTGWSWKTYRYECNGFSTTPSIVTSNSVPSKNDVIPVSPALINPATQGTPYPQSKINLDEAKVMCADLGFAKGTEKFGECVLSLSK